MSKKNNSTIYSAGKIRTYYIIIKSMLLFFKYCIITIFISFSRKENKNKLVDKQIRNWARKILSYPKAQLKVNNPEKIQYEDNQPYILMSNHVSLYDIPIIYLSAPGTIRMIAKKELFRIPLFSMAMRRNKIIPIDRSNREKAKKSFSAAKQKMKNGIVLWMAPEGTRSKTGKLLEFKKGVFVLAIETGAKIYPIGIKGAYDILPPKTTKFKINQPVEVNIGDPIDASEYNLDNKEQLISKTRNAIKELI